MLLWHVSQRNLPLSTSLHCRRCYVGATLTFQYVYLMRDCRNAVNGLDAVTVEKIDPSEGSVQSRGVGNPAGCSNLGLECLHLLVCDVSLSQFYSVEPIKMLDFLMINLQSVRNAEGYENFMA